MGAIRFIKERLKRRKVNFEDCSIRILSKDYILIDTELLALKCICPSIEIDYNISYYYKEYEYNAYKIYRNKHFKNDYYQDPELFISHMFEFSKIMSVDHFIYVSGNNEYYLYDVDKEEVKLLNNREFKLDDSNAKEVGHISFYLLGAYLKTNEALNEFLGKPKISVIGPEGEEFSLNK